ncbi:hypothetical protein [Aeoliella sp. SH292]|uniref:hypothetical protein n=1 Tax=Aeoliella sp. SH292 TaxID=3454464 RepID=UPI003F9A066A
MRQTYTFTPGEIRSDSSYTQAEFERITGLGRAAIRAARRRGLTVRRVGRTNYIIGREWNDYLAKFGEVVAS